VTTGIIGPEGDPQVAAVADRLRGRGHQPVVLDLSRFPRDLALHVRDGVASARDLDVVAVARWYVRSLPLPLPFRVPQPDGPGGERTGRLRYAAGRERRAFLAGFVSAMQATGALFVNPPAAMTQHFRKLDQLDALRSAGVPVPATLATNDPVAVRDFARGRAVVYKPLAGGGRCRALTTADLGRLELLTRAPVLFQEEVPGANIRVYVVHGRVAAAYEIVSGQLDYRGAEAAVEPTRLDDAEHDACLRAAAACGMVFTGIDLRRRPDGGFAVLECNPSPMFAGIQRWTGDDPVTRALADLLEAAQPADVPGPRRSLPS
jgi:hypothetical protein